MILESSLYTNKRNATVTTKYHYLVEDAVISPAEFELARRKGGDWENVLLDEFHVSMSAMGNALSKFLGVPYEPCRSDRIKPYQMLKNLKRTYVQNSFWVPIGP
jgi:hypothetical protein